VPAAGGGPWNTYSTPPWSTRFRSSFTFANTELPGGDQNADVARNVGGQTGTFSTRYSGLVDLVARANSRILPRSTAISNGSSVMPTSD
jgi:hypothetical protein